VKLKIKMRISDENLSKSRNSIPTNLSLKNKNKRLITMNRDRDLIIQVAPQGGHRKS